jgi:hypothetical protein
MKKTWRQKLFSANNDEVDTKAVLSVAAMVIAIGMYLAYGIKGLLIEWNMPAAIRDITVALIIGGAATAGSTLLNQKLGVGPCNPTVASPTSPPTISHPADLPPEEGPAG